ncbi:MAG: LysM peptidoglycan-binding domain-containing protein [Pyrinomonadaceae bacterium]
MAVTDKYQSLIDLAKQLGVSGLNTREENGVLYIDGVAGSASAKQQLWDEYNRIDPDYRSGDLVMNISAPEGGVGTSSGLADDGVGTSSGGSYTVQSGDSLSKIGEKFGVSWQKIYDANRDKLDDPDKIHPGQELTIPGK